MDIAPRASEHPLLVSDAAVSKRRKTLAARNVAACAHDLLMAIASGGARLRVFSRINAASLTGSVSSSTRPGETMGQRRGPPVVRARHQLIAPAPVDDPRVEDTSAIGFIANGPKATRGRRPEHCFSPHRGTFCSLRLW